MSLIESLITHDFKRLTAKNLPEFKNVWSKTLGRVPKNSELLSVYRNLVMDKKIKPVPSLELILKMRAVRSGSGVTPFAVMMRAFPCPGKCIYCPLEAGMPKSYLSDEPAAQRAKMLEFDASSQVSIRLEQLRRLGHETEKIELVIVGGTFSAYPRAYCQDFIKSIYDTLNGKVCETLEEAQVANETAKHRLVGMSVETRPDFVTDEEVTFMRKLGVTKVQLGAQAFDDSVLKTIKRGHTVADIARATELLRNAGLKICYHFMPNLPGSNPELDLAMAKTMFTDPRFIPDYVKIYPCTVIPGTELEKIWEKGDYHSYSDETLIKVLKEIKLLTPKTVRIDRLVRDISKKWVASGTLKSNLRQIIQAELKRDGLSCQCIRCREVKDRRYTQKPDLITTHFNTVGGDEYFLSFEGEDKLYSLLRLRLPDKNKPTLFPEIANSAIIREVHTFGVALSLDSKKSDNTQHQGLGKLLIKRAETISKENGFSHISVISAIGTKGYYAKLGYAKNGLYMTKSL